MKCFITNRECRYDRPRPETPREEEIFMISPFGFPFDDLYKHGIQPVVEKQMGKSIARADQSLQLGYVMCQRICRKILGASSVFVDLTVPNGNVYYELGLAYGLGKVVVFLKGEHSSNPYVKAFLQNTTGMMSYKGLADFADKAKLEKAMASPFVMPPASQIELRANSPKVLLQNPPVILNVVNEQCPAVDFHERAIKEAMRQHNDLLDHQDRTHAGNERKLLEAWTVDTLVVGQGLHITDAIAQLAAAKVCVFDMTHYEDETNAYVFFLLGLAHACERDVVPVINRPINRRVPFDIRGLWQVNFGTIEELESELAQIIPAIDADFKKERDDYLCKQVWDPFLREKHLHVFTCAREAANDEDRGKRTNVDKWDFTSVSELSFFIAQKYETAEVQIEEPKNKRNTAELENIDELGALHDRIRHELADRDCVIIGSPDVSDYAEVAISDLCGIIPHSPEQDHSTLPFVFYKRTEGPDHPRRKSSFYSIPGRNEKDRVVFGSRGTTCVECLEYQDDREGGQAFRGHTCVVITIAKSPYATDGAARHIMILSGFTGIATYAAIKFLTHSDFRNQLQELITKADDMGLRTDDGPDGVNFLLAMDYRKDGDTSSGDTRELTSVVFKAAEAIPMRDSLHLQVKSPEA